MSNIISVPLNKLTRSARNVRKSGSESIDDLASSILVHGLIHNLTVVEQFADNGENSGKYEVVAGGRRFAALQRLAKQKKVPKTFAVPCLVVDPEPLRKPVSLKIPFGWPCIRLTNSSPSTI